MIDLTLTAPSALPQGCDDWRTPPWLYRWAEREWGPFSCDLAASAENHLCPVWYGKGSPHGENGLAASWSGVAWCNPPFSNIAPWVELCHCRPAVILVPANRTEQEWWGRAMAWATERVWIAPRIPYVDPLGAGRSSPGFASVFLVFGIMRGAPANRQARICPDWDRQLFYG